MTELTFSRKQMEVLCWWCDSDSPYQAVICDGAVRSGKTMCMGISFVLWAFYRFDGHTFAFCGKTIRSLKRNMIRSLMELMQGLGFGCRAVFSENYLDISLGKQKNRFYLFGGKDEGSSALIQGMTLSGVLLDEVALMPRSFVEQALARCSVEGAKLWFNCNPESPSHWFYQEWILQAQGKLARYFHFTMDDNPSLSPAVRRRYERLYSGTFYQRFILGEWTAAQGLIYPFMTPQQAWDVPQGVGERYVISCDYGTVNPSSFGLWGKFGGRWYRVEEYYYDSRQIGTSRTDEEHYAQLEALAQGKSVDCVVVDPSAASFLAVIRRHGKFRTVPARNQVVDGIRQVGVALKQGDIRICRNCIHSMREFGLYRWNDDRSRDAPIKENDHAMDDIRYFVATILQGEEDGLIALAAPRRPAGWRGRRIE